MRFNKKSKLIFFVYTIAAFLMIVTLKLGTVVLALEEKQDGKICEGVSVSGIDLSGRSLDEARKLLKDQVDGLMNHKIAIEIFAEDTQKEIEEVTLADLGFEASGEEVVDEVAAIGTKGNLIERYKALKDAKEKKIDHKLDFKYDDEKLANLVKKIEDKYKVEAEDASLKRENGVFKVIGGKTGYSFGEKGMHDTVKAAVDSFVSGLPETLGADTRVRADLVVTKPKYDKEELAKVKDLLGSFTTAFGGGSGRALNIINGASLINGSLLMPGESLSANKKMYPYTLANGYHMGGAFLNGKVVSDIGGGICQVSSTLYNAALYAEVEIEARQNHSMTVDYVPLARDAAIAGDFKDLVIKNNREHPIYLEAITAGGRITFNIYGHETRDVANRKVDFQSVTLQTIAPSKEIVTEDPEKPEDFKSITQKAWVGYKTELYKIVTVNGVQTERTLINKSNYKATPAYVTKGTKKVEKSDEKVEDGKKDKKKKKEQPPVEIEESDEEEYSEESDEE